MNRRGFTFIELVTVWGIIAILAAILFPVFARAQEKARQTSCLSNLQNIGAALKMYAYDNYGHLPPTDNDLWPLLPNYLPEADILICPTGRDYRVIPYPPYPPSNAGLVCDYVYRGGFCDDDLPTNIIAGDDLADLHNGGANYLWLSGRCKWMTSKGRRTYAGQYVPPALPEGFEELQELRKAKTGRTGSESPAPPSGGRL